MKIQFTKMQGLGNDYIYINCFTQEICNPEKLAIRLSDRHFGIGSDGLILIMPSKTSDCRMRMFNADGSESPMCGNGVRCVGKYVYDNNIAKKEIINVETLSGIKTLKMFHKDGVAFAAEVNMGAPVFEASKIPVVTKEEELVNSEFVIEGKTYIVTCISMGNPHCVVFTNDVDNIDLAKIGPLFENDYRFPERVNTEFVEILSPDTLKMRVWERGSGETLACGTGACTCAVAAVLNETAKRGENITVQLKGGELVIRWDNDGNVYMKGPAETVFDGQVNI